MMMKKENKTLPSVEVAVAVLVEPVDQVMERRDP
jgi:hypothetical protein